MREIMKCEVPSEFQQSVWPLPYRVCISMTYISATTLSQMRGMRVYTAARQTEYTQAEHPAYIR